MKSKFVFENFFLLLLRIRFQRNYFQMKIPVLLLDFSVGSSVVCFKSRLEDSFTKQFAGVEEEKICVVSRGRSVCPLIIFFSSSRRRWSSSVLTLLLTPNLHTRTSNQSNYQLYIYLFSN